MSARPFTLSRRMPDEDWSPLSAYADKDVALGEAQSRSETFHQEDYRVTNRDTGETWTFLGVGEPPVPEPAATVPELADEEGEQDAPEAYVISG